MTAQIGVITGASGYVGTELAKQLLEEGYTVRAVVRSESQPALKALGEALPGKLEVWPVADMATEGAYKEVFAGATYVFHVAAVLAFGGEDQEKNRKEIVQPNIDGVTQIITEAAAAKTVKRVVLTSTAFAVWNYSDPLPGRPWSGTDYSDSVRIQDGPMAPYMIGKRDSEKEGFKLADKLSIDLVSICPGLILGPQISSRIGFSQGIVKSILEGKPINQAVPCPHIVDVRDVARAHVLAATTPTAKGRYILAPEHLTNVREISKILKEAYPEYPIQDTEDGPTPQVYKLKVNDLGFGEFITLKKTVLDQARALLALGLVSSPAA